MNDNTNSRPDRIQSASAAVVCLAACLVAAAAVIGAAYRTSDALRADVAGTRYVKEISFDLQFLDYVVLDVKARLVSLAPDAGLLGIGDSSCQFGLAPEAMEATSGRVTLNLGTFGTVGTEGHLAMLDAALAEGARPEAVILWLHPHTLDRDNDEIERIGHGAWLEARLQGGSPAPQSILPRVNDTVGGGLRMAVLDHAGWRKDQLHEHLTPVEVETRLLRDRGWFAAVPQPEPRNYAVPRIQQNALHGLADIAARCAEKGIPLFLAVMPRVSGGSISAESYASLVDEVRAALPGAWWLESMPREVLWSEMQSPTHFAESKAREVSADLGREIRAVLEQGR